MTVSTLPTNTNNQEDFASPTSLYTCGFEKLVISSSATHEAPENVTQNSNYSVQKKPLIYSAQETNTVQPTRSNSTMTSISYHPNNSTSNLSVMSNNGLYALHNNSAPTLNNNDPLSFQQKSPFLQHSMIQKPPTSPSFQHAIPQMQYSPSYQHSALPPQQAQFHHSGMNRPPPSPQQHRQGILTQYPMMPPQARPMPLQINYNRPPPPPNNPAYYSQCPPQQRPMMMSAPVPPPMPPQTFGHVNLAPTVAPSIADGNYLSDSSLSVANSAGKQAKKSQFPPVTKENITKFRNEVMNSNDPRLMLDFAKYLMEASPQLTASDPKYTKKLREAMVMEAQKIVKKLATHSGMGKQGYAEAQFFLANCYGTGDMGLQTDAEKAFSLYVQGSKQNHPSCTYRAGVCYEVGAGTKRDKNHAIQFYRKAANLGDQVAMYKLGIILLKGFLSQPKNPREGISWLKRAAQQADEDHPHALHELGLAYEKEGIPSVIPDLNYARELFTQAAQFGYAPSQFKLGLAYENGFLNCPVDPRRSIAWYSKAAEQGDVEAEFALSGWYLTGAEGILPQSDKEAYLWARKAADRGNAKAEYAVGYYTETGTGTKQNLEEAKRWYMRASAQNYRRATQRLTELKYGNIGPHQRKRHTRENNTSSNAKDSECSIM